MDFEFWTLKILTDKTENKKQTKRSIKYMSNHETSLHHSINVHNI